MNGKYRGDDAVGRLAHDFNCKLSKNMYYKEFAEGVKHFKETEKGREIMCESVEKYADNIQQLQKKQTCKLFCFYGNKMMLCKISMPQYIV